MTETDLGMINERVAQHHLDCAVVSRMGPGTSGTFAMELAVRRSFPPGWAKTSRVLDTGAGPYTGRVIQVVGP